MTDENESKEIINRIFGERSADVVLQELKDAYQRQWDLKENHERKATSIITISGILTSLRERTVLCAVKPSVGAEKG